MINHYLISVGDFRYNLHCYLMTSDRMDFQHACNKAIIIFSEHFGHEPFPVILATPLKNGIDTVRNVLIQLDKKIGEVLEKATDFHFTFVALNVDSEPDKILMKLH